MDNKPNNALGACSWNFLVLNAPTFSSRHFESESGNGNFDQRLLLKHKMVPEFSQTPRQWLKLRFRKYTTIGEFRIQSDTVPHFSSNHSPLFPFPVSFLKSRLKIKEKYSNYELY